MTFSWSAPQVMQFYNRKSRLSETEGGFLQAEAADYYLLDANLESLHPFSLILADEQASQAGRRTQKPLRRSQWPDACCLLRGE